MIKPLRKRHLQVWTVWAILLPVGIISAWLVVPEPVTEKLIQPINTIKPLPVIYKTAEKENYTVNLRHATDTSQWQLEWVNKEVLTWPSATIYQTIKGETGMDNARLIGRIEARGTYYFSLDSTFQPVNLSTYQLILYDFIHQQLIDTINF